MKFSFLPILFNLKDIDFELARLRMRTGMLLRQKQDVLKEMTGMNFHNESDIDYGDNDTMYYIKFTSEIIFFTVSNTLPYFLIAMNRNCNLFRNDINKIVKNNIIVSLGVAAVRFALLHIVLQFSGVYRYELGL